MSTNSDTEPEVEIDEDSLVKASKKVLLQKGGKVKTEKQIAAWEKAQAVRLRKAEIKKEKDDEVAAIRHQNNQLKEQMKQAVPAKKARVKKAPPPPDTDSSETDSSSDDYETDTDDSSESEEEVVVYKKRKPKVHRHVTPSSRRMKPEFKENPVDYNSFFI
jgi:hypothetical protein